MTTPRRETVPALRFLVPVQGWVRHPGLRAPTTWLFVALVAVPPFAALAGNGEDSFFGAVLFAAYFALAWFLVLHVIVRPQGITGGMLAVTAALAIVPGMPLAIGLESAANANRHLDNLMASTFLVGVPEELAKMLPVAVVLFACRRRRLLPREALFLGAVSGLAFGAAEAVTYVVDGQSLGSAIVAVWRIVTDPINHALWAGVSGYFLGLASRYRTPGPWFTLAGLGLGIPALLHGINDWDPVTGGFWWGVLSIVSTFLFLAYARLGIAAPPGAPTPPPSGGPAWTPAAAGRHHPRPAGTGRHAAPSDDPVTAPIALSAMRT